MNPERILIAAEAVGLGRAALKRAADYAKERVVFDRPIGQNQGDPASARRNWTDLEAANLMVFKAAWLYDQKQACGAEANAAKYLAGEAASTPARQAVMTHGGFGYAKEYHVERYLREVAGRAHRAGQAADDPVLHRGERARPAEVVLTRSHPRTPLIPTQAGSGALIMCG